MNIQRKFVLARFCVPLVVFCVISPLRAGDASVLADTYVSSLTAPNDLTHTNFGNSTTLNVGGGSQALIQFDLSKLPNSVSRAVMVVFADKVTTAGSMDVYSLAGPWTESGVSFNGGTNSANVVTTPVPPTKNYLGTVSVTATNEYYSLDITDQVNRWLAGTDLNDGLILLPSSGSALSATFDSKENTSTSHPAYIDILPGSGGTPGGSSGQVQINNAGAFAGITLPASGLLKGAAGPSFAAAAAGTDYAPPTIGTALLKGDGAGGFASAAAGADYALATTGTALLKGNGTGGFANAAPGTDYAPPTAGAAVLKGNGAGGFANAATGTDYAPPTAGAAVLKGNGAGGFSNAAPGTDYAPPTAGAAVLKGNGLGGFSNAAPGADYAPPTIGTALLKGNGAGGFATAAAGTDYAAANAAAVVNGVPCALGSSCTVGAASPSRILYNPSGGTAAKCQAGVAAMAFSFGASGAPSAVCESDGIQAYVDFAAGASQTVYDRFLLPSDWSGSLAVTVVAYATSSASPAITLSLACVTNTVTANPVFGAAQLIPLTPNALSGATRVKIGLQTSGAYANRACAAGDLVEWRMTISSAAAADLRVLSVLFTE